jgi:hypothetical protein
MAFEVTNVNESRRDGTGVRVQGLRTSSRNKARKNAIRSRMERGRTLSRRDARKWTAMCRSAEGVKKAAMEAVVHGNKRIVVNEITPEIVAIRVEFAQAMRVEPAFEFAWK